VDNCRFAANPVSRTATRTGRRRLRLCQLSGTRTGDLGSRWPRGPLRQLPRHQQRGPGGHLGGDGSAMPARRGRGRRRGRRSPRLRRRIRRPSRSRRDQGSWSTAVGTELSRGTQAGTASAGTVYDILGGLLGPARGRAFAGVSCLAASGPDSGLDPGSILRRGTAATGARAEQLRGRTYGDATLLPDPREPSTQGRPPARQSRSISSLSGARGNLTRVAATPRASPGRALELGIAVEGKRSGSRAQLGSWSPASHAFGSHRAPRSSCSWVQKAQAAL
jgi:hypothetical protein